MARDDRPVVWHHPMRALNSKNCSGHDGLFVGILSAWLDWNQEDVMASVEGWVRSGGLELVSDRVEKNVGQVMLSQTRHVLDKFWNYIASDPVANRCFRMAALSRNDVAPSHYDDDRKIVEAMPDLIRYGDGLFAERLGRLIVRHPNFASRWKAIQRERRILQTVNKIHSL